MRAVAVRRYGVGSLEVEERPSPSAGPGEVSIDNRWSSINPVDLETVAGKNKLLMPMRPPFVPGVDVAGTVADVGEGARDFAVGDRVVAYTGVPVAGALAQRVCVPAMAVARVPDSVSLEQAAALCLAGLAGWEALEALELSASGRVLVHGAAGAVGGVVTRLALARGHEVIANVHSRDRDRVTSWGVAQVVAYDEERFEEMASGLDGVVDTVGGDTFTRSISVLRNGGTIASLKAVPHPRVLRSAGFSVPWLLRPVLSLAAAPTHKGAVRIRPVVTTPNGAGLAEVMALAATGTLVADVERTVELDELGLALAALEAGRARGKHVVRLTQ